MYHNAGVAPGDEVNAPTPLTTSRTELLRHGQDREFRQLVHSLLAFSAKLEDVRNAFGSFVGLTGVQYTILISVAHMQSIDEVGIKTLSDHLSLSGPFITNETKKLESFGLVVKKRHSSDRRRICLTTTADGDALLTSLASFQRTINDALFKNLSAGDFDTLRLLTDGLLDGARDAATLVNQVDRKPVPRS